MNGEAHEHAFWLVLTHFFNHQTHHRGQLTTLFMQSGRDPGVTDFIALPYQADLSCADNNSS
jgi:uncharacterized damage-inducible protein DinB